MSFDTAPNDPLTLFTQWFDAARASGTPLPEAMTLATADARARPSARVVLLKGIDSRGFVFYTNYGSRKSRELEANPAAALLLYWPVLDRQIRIEGSVARTSVEESEAYFKTRPLGSQLGAWASRQSEPLPSRAELQNRAHARSEQFGDEVPLPPFWGGFRLVPTLIEFWQGREDRLHDRLLYERVGDGWRRQFLYP